jgi:endonuclease III
MATLNKAQFLAEVLTLLKKRYKLDPSAAKFTVLEAIVYGICHEDATRAQADTALESFKTGFFDWNEVRVSSIAEIQGVLEAAKIRDAEERATRLRRFLRQLFEKTYAFNLDLLAKKPLKDSVKLLQEYEALGSDFVLATVTRLALGGHAIGVDKPTRRALERLGVADPDVDNPTLRGALERAVPKNRGVEFVDLIEELAHDTCVEGPPDCPRCELKKICPTGIAYKSEPATKVAAAAAKAPAKVATSKETPTAAKSAVKPPAPAPAPALAEKTKAKKSGPSK